MPENTFIEDGSELLAWMKKADGFEMTDIGEAELVLRYLKEHGQKLSVAEDGGLLCTDMSTERRRTKRWTIDDLINDAYSQNFHMIGNVAADVVGAKDTGEQEKELQKLGGLLEDEKVLEQLFQKTGYPAEIKSRADGLSEVFLEVLRKRGIEIPQRKNVQAELSEAKWIREGEELIDWMREHDDLKILGAEEADILLGYFDGHDYRLYDDGGHKLLFVNVNEGSVVEDRLDMDDVIIKVRGWNSAMLDENIGLMNENTDPEKEEYYERYVSELSQHETLLDELYGQTKEWKRLAKVPKLPDEKRGQGSNGEGRPLKGVR